CFAMKIGEMENIFPEVICVAKDIRQTTTKAISLIHHKTDNDNLLVPYYKMRNKLMIIVVSALLMLNCNTNKTFHLVEVANPEFIPDTAFVGYEDLTSPKFK